MSDRVRQMIPELGKVYLVLLGAVALCELDWSQIVTAAALEQLLKILLLLVSIGWTAAKWRNEKKKT